jgi:hypothetical protein
VIGNRNDWFDVILIISKKHFNFLQRTPISGFNFSCQTKIFFVLHIRLTIKSICIHFE